jgi:multidrug efflux pump subunit AcrA (membrane-fusion protein)
VTQPEDDPPKGDGSPPSYEALKEQYDDALETIQLLRRDTESLHAIGIYQYMHPLENAVAYEGALTEIRAAIKDGVLGGSAIEASTRFTFDNSLAKGRKMVADLAKLMLRAYNAEAENCVRYVKAGNLKAAQKRLDSAATSIARYAATMEMQISPAYQELRMRELSLTADYQMKVQEEREAAREERARLREEQQAERELRAERERLEKERAHYATALATLIANGQNVENHEVAHKLAELDQAIAHNDYRIANIRAGYVYVISNVGSFGSGIIKIGMTRRIDPMERVRELGSASVPFGFDVHALLFSDDAVGVEAELHRRFAHRRVNRVNLRREYFYTTPTEVKLALMEVTGNLLEFNDQAEAEQYRISEAIRSSEELSVGASSGGGRHSLDSRAPAEA